MPDGHNHDGLIIDATKIALELRARGDAWADTDAAYRALEDTEKTVLAEQFLSAEGSVAQREACARVSTLFREHLTAKAEARKAANRAKVAFDVFKVFIELQRTNASSQRALVELR